jgi:hypothetical protein
VSQAAGGAAAVAATPLQTVTPFIVAIMIQGLAWLAALAIPNRVEQLLNRLSNTGQFAYPAGVSSRHISDIVQWGVDLSASLGTVIGPLTALVLIRDQSSSAVLTLLYVACFFVSIGLFFYILGRDDAGSYLRGGRLRLPAGLVIGIGVNVAALMVAVTVA